jgi:hypothetical protein
MSSANDPEGVTVPARARLNGWKEIASYFGRGVRTVQRWETELELPVRRIGTGRGQVTYAFVEELERWRESADAKHAASDTRIASGGEGTHPVATEGHDAGPAESRTDPAPAPSEPTSDSAPASRPKRRLLAAAITAAGFFVVVVLGSLAWIRSAGPAVHGQPASARVIGNKLTVFDAEGRFLWDHQFAFRLTEAKYSKSAYHESRSPIVIEDVDGDGVVEVLFVSEPWLPTSQGLFCFNGDGSLRFHHVVSREVSYGDTKYGPPWRGAYVSVTGATGRPHDIWFVSSHLQEFPTLLEKLDGAGNSRGEYWSNGQIFTLVTGEIEGRPLVFVGAIDNEFKGGSLAVLDARQPSGSAPATSGHYRCTGCPSGDPLAFLVFPRLDLTAAIGTHSRVEEILIDQLGQVLVTVSHNVAEDVPQELRTNATTQYHLDAQYRVIEADLGERLPSVHRLFEMKGLVDHPFSVAYDSRFLWPVRRWEGSKFVEITAPESPSQR